MEKVVLTREQAEALENHTTKSSATVLNHVKGGWNDRACPLNELWLDEIIRAIYIGYEVEETFDVGDWVISNFFGYAKGRALEIKQITKRKDKTYVYFVNLEGPTHNCYIEDICRHATPEEIEIEKERRWWAKHGRGVREVKKGDIVHDFVLDELDEVMNTHKLEGKFKVICFTEDRKDRST